MNDANVYDANDASSTHWEDLFRSIHERKMNYIYLSDEWEDYWDFSNQLRMSPLFPTSPRTLIASTDG
jgi:hypothetical protein